LSIERFVALLHAYGIERLADIRTVPRSRRNPQFNDAALAVALKAENIDYVPLSALGGLRHARKDSPNTGWRKSWACADASAEAVRLALMAMKGEMGYPSVLTAPYYGLYDARFGGRRFEFQKCS